MMKYTLEAYYQEREGTPHKRVPIESLHEFVGYTLADSILIKAEDRMIEKTIPQVQAFFEYGGRQVVVADLTNRGNVYIEAAEIAE